MKEAAKGMASIFGTMLFGRSRRTSEPEVRTMPSYFFDIKDGHRLVDPSGFDCKNDTDAIDRAMILAIGVSLDKPEVDPTRRIAIRNNAGKQISTVPVYSKPSKEHPAK
jgi:hypothetical protein